MAHGEKGSAKTERAEEWTLSYQICWKNTGLMMSIMQFKLGCFTELLLKANCVIVKNK